jgi:hypothetical protein
LWHTQHVNDVTNAKLPTAQHVKDSQARSIRKRPEHHVNAGWGLYFHIRLREYTTQGNHNEQAKRTFSLHRELSP